MKDQNIKISNTRNNLADLKADQSKSVLLVFDAEWSSTSSMTEVITQKIMQANPDVNAIIIDIEKHEKLSKQYRIRRLPTCVLLRDSELKFRHEGMFSKMTILEKIKTA